MQQIEYLNATNSTIVGKCNIPTFIPTHNNFYTHNNYIHSYSCAKTCNENTISFKLDNNKIKFNEDIKSKMEVLNAFVKEIINNTCDVYLTGFNNYISVKYLDSNECNSEINVEEKYNLTKITDYDLVYELYSNLLTYVILDTSHLLVSVIITVFNSSKTVENCLRSMLNQTHKNTEIIVVDDNSSDNSVELIEQMIKDYPNIKIIKNQTNNGTYYCKNTALSQLNPHTKYIVFQDSDDYSHPERIRKQIEILHYNNGTMSVTLCNRYNELRFACVSQAIGMDIFENKLGYFDCNRFGADSEYLFRYLKYHNIKPYGNYNYSSKGSAFDNIQNIYYCIPHELYIIDNNDENCLTNINPLNSKKRDNYREKYKRKIFNSDESYYNDFTP